MGSEIEITETPKWLQKLEEKREQRLRTKLGHELGAGAPCITCQNKCPGLDLHFWRKICKNCKCSKEEHEVQDDDIYGWAQDELLGTRNKKLRKKIVLPGRKDEVELDWTPNGPSKTIENYLKTVPEDLLPIRGTQAALLRKQLLKKQIPVHDIDPTLCHDLSGEELKKMEEYIGHVKKNIVGVGTLIQIGQKRGAKRHVFDKDDAMFIINNVPKNLSSSTNSSIGKGDVCNQLQKLQNLSISPVESTIIHSENLKTLNRNFAENLNQSQVGIGNDAHFEPIKNEEFYGENSKLTMLDKKFAENSNMNAAGKFDQIRNIKELVFSTFEPGKMAQIPQNNLDYLQNYSGEIHEDGQTPVQFGKIRDINQKTLQSPPHNRRNQEILEENQVQVPWGTDRNQRTESESSLLRFGENENFNESNALQNYPAGCKREIIEDHQVPVSFLGRIRDIKQKTLENSRQNHLQNYNPEFAREIRDDNQVPYSLKLGEINQQNNESESEFSPIANLPNYSAEYDKMQQNVDDQFPMPVQIGTIRDINHQIINHDNNFSSPPFVDDHKSLNDPDEMVISKICRGCSKILEPQQFAIIIPERSSETIYHTGCFKCFGCNQLLADMFYYYDQESDQVYCGRDYAKIRGIPRCKACDELIFLKEYCLAENRTFHVKHFCCFECDQPLAGQNYLMENEQPVCVSCFELTKANKCTACGKVISADQRGLELKENVHFHANEECFACKTCLKSLFGAKLLFRNDSLYCSHECWKH